MRMESKLRLVIELKYNLQGKFPHLLILGLIKKGQKLLGEFSSGQKRH